MALQASTGVIMKQQQQKQHSSIIAAASPIDLEGGCDENVIVFDDAATSDQSVLVVSAEDGSHKDYPQHDNKQMEPISTEKYHQGSSTGDSATSPTTVTVHSRGKLDKNRRVTFEDVVDVRMIPFVSHSAKRDLFYSSQDYAIFLRNFHMLQLHDMRAKRNDQAAKAAVALIFMFLVWFSIWRTASAMAILGNYVSHFQ